MREKCAPIWAISIADRFDIKADEGGITDIELYYAVSGAALARMKTEADARWSDNARILNHWRKRHYGRAGALALTRAYTTLA